MPPLDAGATSAQSSTTNREPEPPIPPAAEVSLNLEHLAVYILVFGMIAEVMFVILDYYVNFGRLTEIGAIRRMFNSTREDGLASWFATTQTLLTALTLWLIYAVSKRQVTPRWKVRSWDLLAIFFTYMAIDDGAAVHERLGTASEKWAATRDAVQSFPSYAWQVLFVPLFAGFGLFMLCFLWKELPRPVDRLLVIAALGCFTVAVVMDYFEGLEDGYGWWVSNYGGNAKTMAHFSKSIEEFLEMLGITILLVTFLGHLARTARTLRFDFH